MLRGTSSIKSSPSTSTAAPALSSTPSEPRHLVPRLLFPHLDGRQPIPPIWPGDSDDIRQLNDEVYLFIALALRAFVQPWYTKITPRDRTLLPRITTILVHLLQALTPRLVPPISPTSSISRPPPPSPLTPFILLHLPIILTHHIRTYHVAASLPLPRPVSTSTTFEALQPHVGVLPAGAGIDPLYLGQIVEGLMKVGLEEEDWESELERGVVKELVARLVLGGVLRKVAEGWFWWGIGLSLFGIKREREDDGDRLPEEEVGGDPLTEKHRPPSPQPPPPPPLSPTPPSAHSRFSPTPYILTLLNLLQTLLTLSILLLSHLSRTLTLLRSSPPTSPYPYILEPWLDLLSSLLQLESPHRASFASRILWWWVRGLGRVVGWLGGDRLIPYVLETKVLTPRTATGVVRKLRGIMFPQGWPVPSPPDPTVEEAGRMREQLEGLMDGKIKGPLRPLLLSSPTSAPLAQREAVSGVLDPFADAQMNSHLLINMLDAVVGVLLPEMVLGGGELGVADETGEKG